MAPGGQNEVKSLTRPRGFDEFAAALTGDTGEAEPLPVRWFPHEPHPKQAAFLRVMEREALFGGAASGGKSDALLMAALQFVHVPGYAALILRRTYQELTLPDALMARAHDWLDGTPAHWNGSEKTWQFPSGAKLVFGYMENRQDLTRYQSAAFQYIGWDELTHFEEHQYRYMFSRCRGPKGFAAPMRIRAATNPGSVGHEWVKARWDIPDEVDFERVYVRKYNTRKGERQRVFIPSKRVDNPSVNQDEYDEMLEELDDIGRMQLDEGRWIRDGTGLVYRSFDAKHNVVPLLPKLPEDETWCRVLGCDFGVTDPTAYVELAFTEHDPHVYVTRSAKWTGNSSEEDAELAKLWEREAGGYDAIVGDMGGMGKKVDATWQKHFSMVMRAAEKTDKLGAIKTINSDFHHRKLLIVAGNDELVQNLQNLTWKDESHRLEHPGQPNHLTDALLYGWREARHWAWEARDESTEAELRRAARRGMDEHERWEVEQLELEQERLGQNELWMAGMGREWPQ